MACLRKTKIYIYKVQQSLFNSSWCQFMKLLINPWKVYFYCGWGYIHHPKKYCPWKKSQTQHYLTFLTISKYKVENWLTHPIPQVPLEASMDVTASIINCFCLQLKEYWRKLAHWVLQDISLWTNKDLSAVLALLLDILSFLFNFKQPPLPLSLAMILVNSKACL